MTEALAPGSTIGILGGGQLGRMLAVAASRLGLKVHIFEPGANPPAGDVAAEVTTASYEDKAALEAFAASVDVVTYEFENVPTEALDLIEDRVPIRPGRRALAVSQDRCDEKAFMESLGIAVAPWAPVGSAVEMMQAVEKIGAPSILKTRRLGYDGKGQVRLATAGDAGLAWARIDGQPSVLEGFVDFEREVSVIAARSLCGRGRLLRPRRKRPPRRHPAHHHGQCRGRPRRQGGRRADGGPHPERAGLCGRHGGGDVRDPGPACWSTRSRPGSTISGHWTIEACVIDQFQQHIRAVAGWPLGDGSAAIPMP